ncbi:MAG: ACP S-malonyltransferase [Thiohalocapsa sp.]
MTDPTLAFVFPGQGSQSVGMLDDLAEAFPMVRDTFTEASDVLGQDLWTLVSQGPEEALDQTENTQPAMLTASVAIWRCWRAQGGALPSVMAGHSLGEYSALVCGGVLAFTDAVALVAERARLMQAAVPKGKGAMAALLGLDDPAVLALCRDQAGEQVLEAVNFNAPGQVVIGGDRDAVERGIDAAKSVGAKRAIMLAMSVPSHCALMRDAAAALSERLTALQVNMPAVDVLHNVNAASAESQEELRALMERQLYRPVRWVDTVRAMAERGVTTAIECGPGKVLAGLGKRIDKRIQFLPVFDRAGMTKALEATADA